LGGVASGVEADAEEAGVGEEVDVDDRAADE
jgi:hypothetical protein